MHSVLSTNRTRPGMAVIPDQGLPDLGTDPSPLARDNNLFGASLSSHPVFAQRPNDTI